MGAGMTKWRSHSGLLIPQSPWMLPIGMSGDGGGVAIPTPTLWWTFADQDGADASGNGNTGTNSSVTFSSDVPPGGSGYSAVCDGLTSHMDAVGPILTDATGSLSFWIKSNDIPNKRPIANSHTDQSVKGFQVYNGGIELWGGVHLILTNIYAADENIWRHVCFAWDADALIGYRDGVEIDSTAGTGGSPISYESHFAIGYNPVYSGDFCNCSLFDVRAFNGVKLTVEQVAALAAAPFSG